ncbi:hexokinase SKDI_12G4740 [Saccharomyces kudriavzevii IFO 1802]|uniref:Phosphotransferase n=2 Tax=Saccharomyces kudriavzevii (strain ATCC MYA-4449 / AS 2.2408 / CBS 8840 / NBRC 1802 / NCYC 2889) TaxID=226230 RepID=J6EDU7_SACK1|nr:uncharacterized protein SKDI_12G4740 [Saccharomyces kudriavzevii IFO 1802]EJT42389.1 YLR446W-like protein [Saccharomyces kudriavzevii IFO 1802]CAI4047221.1 hypothetical protein SKDI_12G4740 [Saccharomyces kudriavzevii IFO 1802]
MTIRSAIARELARMILPADSIVSVVDQFQEELLSRLQTSAISMLPQCSVPDERLRWNPKDRILAIDFGGTRLKFAIVSLPQIVIEYDDAFELTYNIVDPTFFNGIIYKICTKLAENGYVKKKNETSEVTKFFVSVTFSFPLNAKGEVVAMGKGFVMTNALQGLTVKQLIQSSFERIISDNFEDFSCAMNVCDVINDAVAVSLTSKFICENDSISLIIGTGTNACFEVPYGYLPPFKKDSLRETLPSNYNKETLNFKHVLVNSEIGFIGKDVISLQPFDIHGGISYEMPLECVTSGKWLPLSLRNILLQYNIIPKNFPIEFNGELVCQLAEDSANTWFEDQYYSLICQIARLLIKRAAFYVAAIVQAIDIITGCKNYNFIHVGYVGSFLQHSTFYREQIKYYSSIDIKLQFLNHSNLLGAAIATYLNKSDKHV